MNIVLTDCYVNLASEILNQAQKDLTRYSKQKNQKNPNGSLKITKKEYTETVQFLNSEYADYLKKMVIDWKYLIDHLYTPKETTFR